MVAHDGNPRYLAGRGGRILSSTAPQDKLRRPLLKQNNAAGCPWFMPVILVILDAEIRGWFKTSPGEILGETLCRKKASQKKAVG
jgi:hypothetical protein